SGRLRQLDARMREASSDEKLLAALTDDDQARIDAIAQQMGADIEGLHRLYISNTTPDAHASLPLSFAERDMLRRAARGDKVLPEASRVENDWRVSLVHTISSPEAE